MYKVLLIDDEPIIREGMKHVIPWEELGFSICGDCENGRDGLHVIREERPDIVFVDIRMPGMSGIELVQQAKQEGYKGKFVILSGYSSFTYARESIKLGIYSYLLKPIDETELVELLNELKLKIEEEQKISSQLTAYYDMTEEDAWKAVIEGRIDDWQRSPYVKDLEGPFVLVGISVTKNVKRSKLRKRLFEDVKPTAKVILKDQMIYLLYINQPLDQIDQELSFMLRHVREHIDPKAYGCMANSYLTLRETNRAIAQIKQLQDRSYSYPKDRLFKYSDINLQAYQPLDADEIGARIIQALEFKDQSSLKEQLKQMTLHFQHYRLEKAKVQAEMFELVLAISHFIGGKYQDVQLPSKHEWLDIIYSPDSLADLMTSLDTKWWALTDQINGFVVTSENNIDKITRYIEHYYYRDLTLKVLADLFNYNSSYLGKKFKKHTGEYFHVYLERIRIEKAKQLLANQSYKVYKVSELVGYSNMDYFYKKFKKYVGMSPKEFQKKTAITLIDNEE
ncbi:response regulator transcription factor [Amphibacillus sediminis]|uniref:response regulator transcription factor n=1 Tax=Amphibacillus sediminis TaxID=360185 RepID=UPI0008360062|nr:response regulator transcription factor [Amphibacillus sediminis]